MDQHNGCLENNALSDYLDGSLKESERPQVEKHAARCSSCRRRLVERFEFNRERLISSLTPEDVVQRALALTSSPPQAPSEPAVESTPPERRSRTLPLLALLFLILAALAAYFAYYQGLLRF